MRQNEEVVRDALLAQEAVIMEQKRLEAERAKAFADSIAQLPQGLYVQADRSVEPLHPPLVFDVEEARTRIKPVRYSQLGSTVRYIKLSHNLKPAFFHGAEALLTDDGVVISASGGVACFDEMGLFKEVVCANSPSSARRGLVWVGQGKKSMDYRGVYGAPFVIGHKIYYRYLDEPNDQAWIMEYDLLHPPSIAVQQGVEQWRGVTPKGKRKTRLHTKINWLEREMIPLDEYHWVSHKTKWNSSKVGYFLSVHNFSGDTVCRLKDFDPVKNHTGSTYRGVEGGEGDLYRLKGQLHVRQNLNDTIYRFESVNRVRPLYVVDFGKRKIGSSTMGLSPRFELKEKFVHYSLLETNRFVFVFYTQDYACPMTAKRGTLLFNSFVYDKITNEQFHTYIDEKPDYTPGSSFSFPRPPRKGIINDLDYGITTWDFKQTEGGKLYKLLKGEELKAHIQSVPGNPSSTHKNLLKKIAETSADDDLFLMIIE